MHCNNKKTWSYKHYKTFVKGTDIKKYYDTSSPYEMLYNVYNV